jgi:hypothetical protein
MGEFMIRGYLSKKRVSTTKSQYFFQFLLPISLLSALGSGQALGDILPNIECPSNDVVCNDLKLKYEQIEKEHEASVRSADLLENLILKKYPNLYYDYKCEKTDLACKKQALTSKQSEFVNGKLATPQQFANLFQILNDRIAYADSQKVRFEGTESKYDDKTDAYSTEAGKWNQNAAKPELDPVKLCAQVNSLFEKKTNDDKWTLENCPKFKTDAQKASLKGNQAKACAFFDMVSNTTVKDLCVAKKGAEDATKTLKTLAIVNAGVAAVCWTEYVIMKAAAEAQKAAAAGGTSSANVKRYLVGKNKPWACATAALGSIAFEVVKVIQAANRRSSEKENTLYGTNKTIDNTGKISASSKDLNSISKTVNTIAAAGINVAALTKALSLILGRGVCTPNDMASGSTAPRCKALSSNLARELDRRIASEVPATESLITRFQNSFEDQLFIEILGSIDPAQTQNEMGNDPTSLELIQILTEDFARQAGA